MSIFTHPINDSPIFFIYRFKTDLDDEINGVIFKCQGPGSTFSAVILELCFVITSYQVFYFINIFDEIIEKCMSFTLYNNRLLIQLRLNNVLS